MKVRITPAAQSDIEGVYCKIAMHNPQAAQAVEDLIRETIENLQFFPGVGVTIDVEDVRRLPLVRYPYTLYYRINLSEPAVEILRVVPSATIKDLRRLPS